MMEAVRHGNEVTQAVGPGAGSSDARCAMTPAMWDRAKPLLADAAEQPEADRERYVLNHCPDPELRHEILVMLATPAALSDIVTACALKSGDYVGAYRIEQLIARGGMGEVYRARDVKLNRDIAIKVLPKTVAADPVRRERFEREVRTIAALKPSQHRHGSLCGES